MLWIVDYLNPRNDEVDCLIIEADCRDHACEQAIRELKILEIPKRYIVKMEEFLER